MHETLPLGNVEKDPNEVASPANAQAVERLQSIGKRLLRAEVAERDLGLEWKLVE